MDFKSEHDLRFFVIRSDTRWVFIYYGVNLAVTAFKHGFKGVLAVVL